MPTAKDPPSDAHHLRLNGISDEMLVFLKGLKGWCIVSHQGGSKGEHPHMHCFIKHQKPCTKVTVKDRLRKSPPFQELKGNEDWSFRQHNSFEAWWQYVWRDPTRIKKPELLLWSMDFEQPEIPQQLPDLVFEKSLNSGPRFVVLETPDKSMEVKKSEKKSGKTSLEKQQMFLEYCQMRHEECDEPITKEKICKYALDLGVQRGFTVMSSLSTWVMYAYYSMAPEEARLVDADALARKLFPG